MTNTVAFIIATYTAINFLCAGIYIGNDPNWDFMSYVKLLTHLLFGGLIYGVLYGILGANWVIEKIAVFFHIKFFYRYWFTEELNDLDSEQLAKSEEIFKEFKKYDIIGRYCIRLVQRRNNYTPIN